MRAEKDEMLEKHFQKWCVSALVEGSLNKYEREEKKKKLLVPLCFPLSLVLLNKPPSVSADWCRLAETAGTYRLHLLLHSHARTHAHTHASFRTTSAFLQNTFVDNVAGTFQQFSEGAVLRVWCAGNAKLHREIK